MSTDNKPDWCPQELWDETSSAFDVLYESEPDLEGGCEYGIRSMAAAVALVAIATERERAAKVCEENERMRSALEEIYERGLYRQSGYKNGFYASFKTARRALRIPHMTFDEALATLERERQSRGQ